MEGPHPGGTALLITVAPTPGKYEDGRLGTSGGSHASFYSPRVVGKMEAKFESLHCSAIRKYNFLDAKKWLRYLLREYLCLEHHFLDHLPPMFVQSICLPSVRCDFSRGKNGRKTYGKPSYNVSLRAGRDANKFVFLFSSLLTAE